MKLNATSNDVVELQKLVEPQNRSTTTFVQVPQLLKKRVATCGCSRRRKAQCLILLGAAMFSVANSLVKYGNEVHGTSSWSIMMIRALITTCTNMVAMYCSKGCSGVNRLVRGLPEPSERLSTQLQPTLDLRVYGRGVAGAFLTLSLIGTFTYLMTFADAFSIYVGGSTVMGLAFAAFFLGERLRLPLVIGAFLTIAGVVSVAKPAFIFGSYNTDRAGLEVNAHETTLGQHPRIDGLVHDAYRRPTTNGVLILMFSSAMAAIWYATTRCLKDHAPETLLHGHNVGLLIFSIFILVMGSHFLDTGSIAESMPHSSSAWVLVLIYTLLAQIAQILAAIGFKDETAAVGTVLANTEVLFAFIMDATFLGEAVDLWSVLGGFTVLSGAAVVVMGSSGNVENDLVSQNDAQSV